MPDVIAPISAAEFLLDGAEGEPEVIHRQLVAASNGCLNEIDNMLDSFPTV